MTPLVLDFVERNKGKLQGKVIEVGSFYVNGTVRDVVDIFVGTDMRKGAGVDLVCPAQSLLDHFEPKSFDALVSTETLEHVEDWRGFVKTTWDIVKDGGWLVMTIAHKNKGKHAYPDDYWRFEPSHIKAIYPTAEVIELCKPGKKAVSLAWTVQKNGDLGSLDFDPIKVK